MELQLQAKVEQAREEIARLEADLRYWAGVLEHAQPLLQLEHDRRIIKLNGNSLDLAKLPGMSVRNALMEIAKLNDGILLTVEATKTLCQAGVFGSEAEARDNVYSTLAKSRTFIKIAPGQYKIALHGVRQPKAITNSAVSRGTGLVKRVRNLLTQHPDWKHPDLLNALTSEHWDFHGKTPTWAVSMALGRIALDRKRAAVYAATGQGPKPSSLPLPIRH